MRLSEHPLIEEATIATRVAELAREIDVDYAEADPLLVGVLKGAMHFTSDLLRALRIPCEVEFLSARSYEGTESTGGVQLDGPDPGVFQGRQVIVVEDILDTGRTAVQLISYIQTGAPISVAVCTLLDKPTRRVVPVQADYTGFTVGDHFVVGYGLDYNQHYRGLRAIHTLETE